MTSSSCSKVHSEPRETFEMKRFVKTVEPNKCLCYPLEARQLICKENQLTGFYVRATLALNGLMAFTLLMNLPFACELVGPYITWYWRYWKTNYSCIYLVSKYVTCCYIIKLLVSKKNPFTLDVWQSSNYVTVNAGAE